MVPSGGSGELKRGRRPFRFDGLLPARLATKWELTGWREGEAVAGRRAVFSKSG